jgi:hypothetical protein
MHLWFFIKTLWSQRGAEGGGGLRGVGEGSAGEGEGRAGVGGGEECGGGENPRVRIPHLREWNYSSN